MRHFMFLVVVGLSLGGASAATANPQQGQSSAQPPGSPGFTTGQAPQYTTGQAPEYTTGPIGTPPAPTPAPRAPEPVPCAPGFCGPVYVLPPDYDDDEPFFEDETFVPEDQVILEDED